MRRRLWLAALVLLVYAGAITVAAILLWPGRW